MSFFDYVLDDFIFCEGCEKLRAVDIHHINGRHGKDKGNTIENLVALCRSCHTIADNKAFNEFIEKKHFENIEKKRDNNTMFAESKHNKIIKIRATKETLERWLELRERIKNINGYDNPTKAFEFAIVEALNIPIESYG